MDFVRFKFVLAAPRPEARYLAASDEEVQAGAPRDPSRTIEGTAGAWPATFEALVRVGIERCDAGRCAQCRDNSRVRYVLRASDQHGIKKWCAGCLREWYAIDVEG
jgi:hypothetical protein